jgi:hypothetical protein
MHSQGSTRSVLTRAEFVSGRPRLPEDAFGTYPGAILQMPAPGIDQTIRSTRSIVVQVYARTRSVLLAQYSKSLLWELTRQSAA